MLKQYPKFKRGEVDKIYKKLPKTEQKLIQDYLFYRQAGGLTNTSDLKRLMIQIRHIINCNFKDFKTLEQHTRLIVLIKESYLSNETIPNIKINLNNFFGEYLFSGWWDRKFRKIYSNKKLKGDGSENTNINNIPTDLEIEKMLKSETSIFYKTFFLIQEVTGMRTKECRCIELDKVEFNSDGTATIEIYMTKTGKTKIVFTDKQTTDYIKKLIEELKNLNRYKKYLFPAPKDINKPIHKNTINKWFRSLSFRATGKYYKNYSLRHRKSKMLYELSDKNIISENTALKLLGHGRSQKERYVNRAKEEDIKILKEQAFNTEVSPEKKAELEQKLENYKKELDRVKKLVLALQQAQLGHPNLSSSQKKKIQELGIKL